MELTSEMDDVFENLDDRLEYIIDDADGVKNKVSEIREEIEELKREICGTSDPMFSRIEASQLLDDLASQGKFMAEKVSAFEKKSRPARLKLVTLIRSEEDPEVTVGSETEYFDWGLTDIGIATSEMSRTIAQLKELVNEE